MTASLAGLLAIPLLAGTLLTLAAPAAHAEEVTDLPGTLSTASSSSSTVSVDVPDGVTATAFVGRLDVDEQQVTGRLTFSISGRLAATVTPADGPVILPVLPGDVTDRQTLDVTMSYAVTDRCPGGSAPSPARLDHLRLRYEGTERAPTALDEFFPAYSPRIDVVIGQSSGDDVLAAGLAAVAALSHRYDATTEVHLLTADQVLPRVGIGQRVVRLISRPGTTTTTVEERFGLQTLNVAGEGTGLLDAARALGSSSLALASGPTTTGLAASPTRAGVALDQTFSALGAGDVTLQGPAQASRVVGIRQDAFGGPVDTLTIHVVGTHSVVPPGTQAQLNTYLNDRLIDSQLLDDDPALAIDVTAGATMLNPVNGLEFRLSISGSEAGCSGPPGLPIEVSLDGGLSTVTAERGAGVVTGFQAFPQVLGGELPVAIASSDHRVQDAIDASLVITALQREADEPLTVDLVDIGEFLDGDRSGLVVGAGAKESSALDAPLRYEGMRLIADAEQLRVGTDQPFAAFEAIDAGGRHVLMLGAWSPDPAADVSPMMRRAATRVADRGWRTLSDDLLVASGDRPVFSLGSAVVSPQAARSDERRGYVWWLVGGVGVILLLLAFQAVRTTRRSREVRALVDAQEHSDHDDVGHGS